MADIIVQLDPITNINLNTQVVSVPPELGVTLTEIQTIHSLVNASEIAVGEDRVVVEQAVTTVTDLVNLFEYTKVPQWETYLQDHADQLNSEMDLKLTEVNDKHADVLSMYGEISGYDLSNYYDKSVIDSKFALIDTSNYVTFANLATEVNSEVSGFAYSKAYIDGELANVTTQFNNLDYYTQAEVDAAIAAKDLSGYLTSASAASTYQSQAAMSGYYDRSEVDGLLTAAVGGVDFSDFHTKSEIAAFDYISSSAVAASYQTKSAMSSYDTSSQVDSKISSAVGNVDLSPYLTLVSASSTYATIASTYTQAATDQKITDAINGIDLSPYSTTTEADELYLAKMGTAAAAQTAWALGGTSYDKFLRMDQDKTVNAVYELRKGFIGAGGSKANLTNTLTSGYDIWSLGTGTRATNYGSGYMASAVDKYGLTWLRSDSDGADVDVGEGMYVFKDGVIYGGMGELGIFSAGDIVAFSDKTLKSDLRPIEDPLVKLSRLAGFNYLRDDLGIRQDGVIAQDVQVVLPDSIKTVNNKLAVNHNGIIALLVEAVNELAQRGCCKCGC